MGGSRTTAGRERARERAAVAAPRRAYLRSDERRRQLLAAAAKIAGSEGVERLTIVGLAREAGVSRQLVYDHFSDLQGLVGALLEDRFAAADGAIHEAISAPGALGSREDAIEVALQAARVYLSLSREDRHILRSVLSATDAPEHELNGLALQLRGHSINRWQPALGGEDEPVSRARAWALANALNGLGDLVSTGELDAQSALEEFGVLLRASIAAPRPPRRGTRRAGARAARA